jgi:predicted small integral membrane protein
MALAGVWEKWHSPAGEWVRSFAIVTTTSKRIMRRAPQPHAGDDYARGLASMAPRAAGQRGAIESATDYDTNYAFVRHVLSMDTTFPGNALLYRRIFSPALWQAVCALIIAGEGLTGIALAVATISLVRHLRSDGVRFNGAKRFTIIGASLGFLVWFFGFMVVGGEWYSMWQSPMWNGQEAAFRFYMTILAVLIFVNQSDGDLAARARGSSAD